MQTNTDRRTDRQTDTHVDKHTGRHKKTDRQTDRQTDMQTNTDRRTDRQTDRQLLEIFTVRTSIGIQILGIPIGHQEYVSKVCMEVVKSGNNLCQQLSDLNEPQGAMIVLRHCHTTRLNHLAESDLKKEILQKSRILISGLQHETEAMRRVGKESFSLGGSHKSLQINYCVF